MVRIDRPWYQRGWAICLLFLFFWPAGLLCLILRLNANAKRERASKALDQFAAQIVANQAHAMPYVDRFLDSFLPSHHGPSVQATIPVADVQALHTILERDAIHVPYEWLKRTVDGRVNEALHALRVERVAASMASRSDAAALTWMIDDLDRLDGRSFELFLARLFEAMGYRVTVTPASGDQGADLLISRANEAGVVQAKRYEGSVSNGAVQEVLAARAYYNANRAIVVTTSTYTPSAFDLARRTGVELWDRHHLQALLATHRIPK